jgi:ANTAR domain
MTDLEQGAGQPDREQQRQVRQVVSALRARGGVGALGAGCHRDLPDVDGVVLTVFAAHAGWIIVSDSGPRGDQLEDLHATLQEGPGIDAAGTNEIVAAADLNDAEARTRWPRFVEPALGCGLHAVFAYPVRWDTRPVGVLGLYRAAPGPLSVTDDERARRYAAAAAILLLDDLDVSSAQPVAMALPADTGEVQQAVGVVMEYAGVDAATALHRLRVYARSSDRPMRDVVAEVRACQLPFDPTVPT